MSSGVAIVITCYNYGQYVREAVDSVLKQNIPVEMVVVDDGSTDPDTLSALQQLSKNRINVFHQTNQGLPAARNAGIKLTSADVIVCLDADDVLQPTYCSSCLAALQSGQHVGFVYSTTQVFGTENKLWSRAGYSGLHLLVDNYLPYSAMFRRQIWKEVGGFSEEMRHGYEDWDFWLGAVEKGWKGFHVPEPLFRYRKHGKSMSSFSNLERRPLKKLLRQRHPRLYSFRNIASLATQERLPLPRIIGAVARENLRSVIARVKNRK